jgi:hypothetical protein
VQRPQGAADLAEPDPLVPHALDHERIGLALEGQHEDLSAGLPRRVDHLARQQPAAGENRDPARLPAQSTRVQGMQIARPSALRMKSTISITRG